MKHAKKNFLTNEQKGEVALYYERNQALSLRDLLTGVDRDLGLQMSISTVTRIIKNKNYWIAKTPPIDQVGTRISLPGSSPLKINDGRLEEDAENDHENVIVVEEEEESNDEDDDEDIDDENETDGSRGAKHLEAEDWMMNSMSGGGGKGKGEEAEVDGVPARREVMYVKSGIDLSETYDEPAEAQDTAGDPLAECAQSPKPKPKSKLEGKVSGSAKPASKKRQMGSVPVRLLDPVSRLNVGCRNTQPGQWQTRVVKFYKGQPVEDIDNKKKRKKHFRLECMVPDCYSRFFPNKFVQFPEDPEQRIKWAEMCRLQEKFPDVDPMEPLPERLGLCFKHFRKDDFIVHATRVGLSPKLKEGKEPTLFPWDPTSTKFLTGMDLWSKAKTNKSEIDKNAVKPVNNNSKRACKRKRGEFLSLLDDDTNKNGKEANSTEKEQQDNEVKSDQITPNNIKDNDLSKSISESPKKKMCVAKKPDVGSAVKPKVNKKPTTQGTGKEKGKNVLDIEKMKEAERKVENIIKKVQKEALAEVLAEAKRKGITKVPDIPNPKVITSSPKSKCKPKKTDDNPVHVAPVVFKSCNTSVAPVAVTTSKNNPSLDAKKNSPDEEVIEAPPPQPQVAPKKSARRKPVRIGMIKRKRKPNPAPVGEKIKTEYGISSGDVLEGDQDIIDDDAVEIEREESQVFDHYMSQHPNARGGIQMVVQEVMNQLNLPQMVANCMQLVMTPLMSKITHMDGKVNQVMGKLDNIVGQKYEHSDSFFQKEQKYRPPCIFIDNQTLVPCSEVDNVAPDWNESNIASERNLENEHMEDEVMLEGHSIIENNDTSLGVIENVFRESPDDQESDNNRQSMGNNDETADDTNSVVGPSLPGKSMVVLYTDNLASCSINMNEDHDSDLDIAHEDIECHDEEIVSEDVMQSQDDAEKSTEKQDLTSGNTDKSEKDSVDLIQNQDNLNVSIEKQNSTTKDNKKYQDECESRENDVEKLKEKKTEEKDYIEDLCNKKDKFSKTEESNVVVETCNNKSEEKINNEQSKSSITNSVPINSHVDKDKTEEKGVEVKSKNENQSKDDFTCNENEAKMKDVESKMDDNHDETENDKDDDDNVNGDDEDDNEDDHSDGDDDEDEEMDSSSNSSDTEDENNIKGGDIENLGSLTGNQNKKIKVSLINDDTKKVGIYLRLMDVSSLGNKDDKEKDIDRKKSLKNVPENTEKLILSKENKLSPRKIEETQGNSLMDKEVEDNLSNKANAFTSQIKEGLELDSLDPLKMENGKIDSDQSCSKEATLGKKLIPLKTRITFKTDDKDVKSVSSLESFTETKFLKIKPIKTEAENSSFEKIVSKEELKTNTSENKNADINKQKNKLFEKNIEAPNLLNVKNQDVDKVNKINSFSDKDQEKELFEGDHQDIISDMSNKGKAIENVLDSKKRVDPIKIVNRIKENIIDKTSEGADFTKETDASLKNKNLTNEQIKNLNKSKEEKSDESFVVREGKGNELEEDDLTNKHRKETQASPKSLNEKDLQSREKSEISVSIKESNILDCQGDQQQSSETKLGMITKPKVMVTHKECELAVKSHEENKNVLKLNEENKVINSGFKSNNDSEKHKRTETDNSNSSEINERQIKNYLKIQETLCEKDSDSKEDRMLKNPSPSKILDIKETKDNIKSINNQQLLSSSSEQEMNKSLDQETKSITTSHVHPTLVSMKTPEASTKAQQSSKLLSENSNSSSSSSEKTPVNSNSSLPPSPLEFLGFPSTSDLSPSLKSTIQPFTTPTKNPLIQSTDIKNPKSSSNNQCPIQANTSPLAISQNIDKSGVRSVSPHHSHGLSKNIVQTSPAFNMLSPEKSQQSSSKPQISHSSPHSFSSHQDLSLNNEIYSPSSITQSSASSSTNLHVSPHNTVSPQNNCQSSPQQSSNSLSAQSPNHSSLQSPQRVHNPISSHPSSSQSLNTALVSPQKISQPSFPPHHTSPQHDHVSHTLSPKLSSSQLGKSSSPDKTLYRNIEETSLKQPSQSSSRALHVIETVLPEVGNSPTHKPSNDSMPSYIGTSPSNVGSRTHKHRSTAALQDTEVQDIALDHRDKMLAPDTLRNKSVKDSGDLPRSTSNEEPLSSNPSYIASQEIDVSKTELIKPQLPNNSLNLDGKMSVAPLSSRISNSDNNSKVVNNHIGLLGNSPQCQNLATRESSMHSSSLSAMTSNFSPSNNSVGQHSQPQETHMPGMIGNYNPVNQQFGNSSFPTIPGNLGMDPMNAQSRLSYPMNNSSNYAGSGNFNNMGGNNQHMYNDPGYDRRNWNRPPAPMGDFGSQSFGNMNREGRYIGEGPPPRKREPHGNTYTNNSQFKTPRFWNYHNS